jgi:hypothetical protein
MFASLHVSLVRNLHLLQREEQRVRAIHREAEIRQALSCELSSTIFLTLSWSHDGMLEGLRSLGQAMFSDVSVNIGQVSLFTS